MVIINVIMVWSLSSLWYCTRTLTIGSNVSFVGVVIGSNRSNGSNDQAMQHQIMEDGAFNSVAGCI
jgi:hypothetical protein